MALTDQLSPTTTETPPIRKGFGKKLRVLSKAIFASYGWISPAKPQATCLGYTNPSPVFAAPHAAPGRAPNVNGDATTTSTLQGFLQEESRLMEAEAKRPGKHGTRDVKRVLQK